MNKIHDESFSVNENDFESFYVASKNLLNFLNIKKIEVLQKEIITNYFNRAILRTLIQKGKIKEFSKIFTLLDDKRKLKNFYLFCIFFLLKYFKKFLLLFFSFKKIHAIRHFFLLDKIFKSSF